MRFLCRSRFLRWNLRQCAHEICIKFVSPPISRLFILLIWLRWMEIYRPRHKVRFHSVFFPLLSLLSFLNVSLFFIFTEIVEWEKKNMKNSSNFHFSLLKTGRRPYNVVSSFFSREYTVLQINSNLCKICCSKVIAAQVQQAYQISHWHSHLQQANSSF